MASPKTQRKLTAIPCSDVVGNSRLMGADEEATIETLAAYRRVFLSQIESHRSRRAAWVEWLFVVKFWRFLLFLMANPHT